MSCVYSYTYAHNIRTNIRVYCWIGSFHNSPGAISLHNTCIYIHIYADTYQRRFANAAGPAQHTLVGRGLTVVEPVAHALFQRGPALEPFRSADIEHTHRVNPVSVLQSGRRLEGTRVFRMPSP